MNSSANLYHLFEILPKISASKIDGNGIFQSEFFRDYAEKQINLFRWYSLIIITVLLLCKIFKFFRLWHEARPIPGPPCPSFFGHSKLISRGNILDILSKSHSEYGPVVKMWTGPTDLVVSIKDTELIKEILLKANDKLPQSGKAFRLAFGQSSLFIFSFDKVEERRNSLAKELHGKMLRNGNMIPTEVLDYIMENLQVNIGKGSIDRNMISQRLAFPILGTLLFGDEFLAWSKATVYEELLMMIAKDACVWASYNVTPFWKRGFWYYQCLCKKLLFLTQDIIEQSKKTCKHACQVDEKPCYENTDKRRTAAPCSQNSFSDKMSANIFSRKLDGYLAPREELCGTIASVMFHACLTTADLISNILAMLVMHPEIQDKIHSEISIVRKNSLKPTQHDVENMPILLATVYESARLFPGRPSLQRCSLKQDLKLRSDVTIPAGALLLVPLQLVQKDHSSWGNDASQFNPYRFLSKDDERPDLPHLKSFTASGGEPADSGSSSYVLNDLNASDAFLPFGSGTRACVGKKFTILGVATLFASLLERYEILPQQGSEKDPEPMMNSCVVELLPSPKILFIKRNSCMNKKQV